MSLFFSILSLVISIVGVVMNYFDIRYETQYATV